jgi:hypothetical protein
MLPHVGVAGVSMEKNNRNAVTAGILVKDLRSRNVDESPGKRRGDCANPEPADITIAATAAKVRIKSLFMQVSITRQQTADRAVGMRSCPKDARATQLRA